MSEKGSVYKEEFLPGIIKLGKLCGWLGVIAAFFPALAMLFIYDTIPPFSAIITGFVSIAAAVGVLWFIEPISYFPVLGIPGTYLAFLSGNISNMRLPCAAVAQAAVGVEPGTEAGGVISTIGITVSTIINIAVLTLAAVLGQAVLSSLPPSVLELLNYLLPALFGALFVQFALKNLKIAPIALGLGLLIYILLKLGVFSWLPGAANFLPILFTVFATLLISVAMYNKSAKKNN